MAHSTALFDEIRDRLLATVRPLRIVVFGSMARGDATSDSDLDLMVVADVCGSIGERARQVGAPLVGLPVPLDLVVYTPEEYARLRQWRSSVAAIADREGVVLHG